MNSWGGFMLIAVRRQGCTGARVSSCQVFDQSNLVGLRADNCCAS